MFNHTLWSLIAKIVTTNASISPFNLLIVHKILFYTCSLAIYNFFLVTRSSEHYIKWAKWPRVSFLLLKKHWRSVCQKRECWSKWKYEIDGKTPIPIIIRYFMKFSLLYWFKFSVLAAKKLGLFVVDPIGNHVRFYCNDYMPSLSLHCNCFSGDRCPSATKYSFVPYFLRSTYI